MSPESREPPCLLTNAGIFLLPILTVAAVVVANLVAQYYLPDPVRIALVETGVGALLTIAGFVAAVGFGLYFLWKLPFSSLTRVGVTFVYLAVMIPLLGVVALTVAFAFFDVYY